MPTSPLETCKEFAPASQAELRRFVKENDAGDRNPVYPVGGRTSLQFDLAPGGHGHRPQVGPEGGRTGGQPPPAGTLLSTSRLAQTVDYPAADMTITVEAGMRIDDLACRLRESNQQLPIDVAQSNRATLGGVVATNTAGPRRYGLGTIRDYVIGVSAVDARGRLFHAGGRVVKNVAGYDLCKLLVGSMGTLAVITQLTLKLRPLPESTAILWASFNKIREIDAALERLLTSAARPVALEVLNPDAARLVAAESRQQMPNSSLVLAIGVEGTRRECSWQVETLKRELFDLDAAAIEVAENEPAVRLLGALTEFQTASDDPVTFQANLLPSRTMEFVDRATASGVAAAAHAGDGIVIGHLPDEVTTIGQAEAILDPLRNLARRSRGNMIVLNCEAEWMPSLPIFGLPEPAHPLFERLKQTLDPHNVLNPGRFVSASPKESGSF